ncbi:prepilin-type N-terminal cleavage/methylation domain-containing protein [Candidatus Peregrinibacteria bacterium]|nr:prepilin-type N-terminal cleavage/methylation domain-containing protein [Candidatus Peregrinibacteria bacterium]
MDKAITNYRITNYELRRNKGFSLVELLVVVTIIAILSVVAYTAVGGQTAKARDSRRQQDLTSIQSGLELYFVENNAYPVAGAGDTISATELTGKYLSKVPTDPKPVTVGQKYRYKVSGSNYILAATLENDAGKDNDLAYVVTKGETPPTLTGQKADSSDCDSVLDAGTCLPYLVTPAT